MVDTIPRGSYLRAKISLRVQPEYTLVELYLYVGVIIMIVMCLLTELDFSYGNLFQCLSRD